METPFKYGTLADKDTFVNRTEERKLLKDFLSTGIHVMLISPRRWGKSSLVSMAMKELEAEQKGNIRVCYIDAFSMNTEEEFYRTFAREVIKCTANTLSFDLKINSGEKEMLEVLALPEKIAKEKGIRIIVCIDEFQQIASFRNYKALEGKMRSVWQQQHHVSYCFSGSKRHMMMDIFNNSSNPFYRFGQVLFLQKIKKEEWVNYIVLSFRKTGREISDTQAGYITDIVKCHSWYVQQLCYFIWSGTQASVTDELIEQRIQLLIDTNMPMYMNDCEKLTSAQIAMLRAIASGENRLSSAKTVTTYGLGNSQAITRNKRILQEEDFIDKTGEAFTFSDPVFELWFRRQYM